MGRKIRLPGTSMGPFFFRKYGTWMGVPVLIGTSMGHFLSLRYIDGPFFIIEVHRWAIFYHYFVQKENNALCHMYINKIIFLLLNQLMFVKFP